MEKDVLSCALELKNETSWTSWAMTGLSAKMTGYKNKNQQPSVALNMQPLGPPPSLVIPSTAATSEKASPNKAQSSLSPQNKSQKPEIQASVDNKPSQSYKIESTSKIEENNTGWNLDDEWKDLDDDGEQMEPLEISNTMSYLNQSSKNVESKASKNSNNNDWSSWTNSFEDEKNTPFNDSNKQTKNSSTNNSQSQLPMASSYNWSAQNEEDLFSSLVKDININNKKSNQSANTASGWSSDWNDLEDKPQKDGTSKRQERQQRNVEKQTENEKKQSKPLKLGQKKDPIF